MVELGGRHYAKPRQRTAVFCVDGCAPEYLDVALERGRMPRLASVLRAGGVYTRGFGQMPSFTNPNNLSIVTGLTTREHGISGNTILDRDKGAEVPMNEPRWLRSETLFEAFERAGVRTLCVTAKDKLRAMLGARRAEGGPVTPSFSAEKAHEQEVPGGGPVVGLVGRKNPGIYDWDNSHYAMEMGLLLADRLGAELVYVSLTDYVQHKEPPTGPLADKFYVRFDQLLGSYLEAGFRCAFTADHGMNDKTRPDGSPNVRYLEDLLEDAGVRGCNVVLPITDPYVVHHGALGGYATVYVADEDARARAKRTLAAVEGVDEVLESAGAAERFALPADRIGDLVVLAAKSTVLGKRRGYHDLSAVSRGLRSHGSLHELEVPLVVCHPLAGDVPARLENRDIFDLVLNRVR